MDSSQAASILREDFPELGDLNMYPSDKELRAFLADLSEVPEYEPHLRAALEHRLVAFAPGMEAVALSTLVVFLLSLDFKLEFKRKSGKSELHLKASKKPTPIPLVRAILVLLP